MLYLIVIMCVVWYLVRALGIPAVFSRLLPDTKIQQLQGYPELRRCIDAFPEGESVYKNSMFRHTQSVLDAYQHSFRSDVDVPTVLARMRRGITRAEASAQEILFRLPNDLKLETLLRDNLKILIETLHTLVSDIEARFGITT